MWMCVLIVYGSIFTHSKHTTEVFPYCRDFIMETHSQSLVGGVDGLLEPNRCTHPLSEVMNLSGKITWGISDFVAPGVCVFHSY